MEQAPPGAVTVVLPAALVALFPGSVPRLALGAATVGELLDGLDARWPGMADRLRDTRPAIRRHLAVFVDGRRADLDSALAPGSEVVFLTKVSGG